MIELKTYRGNKLLFIDEEFDTLVKVVHNNGEVPKLEFINQDGSKAEICGNAIMQYAIDFLSNKKSPTSGLLVNGVFCEKYNDKITVKMPKVEYKKAFGACFFIEELPFFTAKIGNEHDIYFHAKKYHEFLGCCHTPNEIKHNFSCVDIIDDSTLFVDTYERCVGKTESCGSAACCAAWVYCKEYIKEDKHITVKQNGGDIIIDCTGESPVMVHKL